MLYKIERGSGSSELIRQKARADAAEKALAIAEENSAALRGEMEIKSKKSEIKECQLEEIIEKLHEENELHKKA